MITNHLTQQKISMAEKEKAKENQKDLALGKDDLTEEEDGFQDMAILVTIRTQIQKAKMASHSNAIIVEQKII